MPLSRRLAALLATTVVCAIAGPSAAQTPPDADSAAATPPLDMAKAMKGALAPYPMTREASGTAWQPDTSEHNGIHVIDGQWLFMFHALLNGVYDQQNGPRGDQLGFVSGMLMGMAKRPFDNGDTLQFRAMLSPEPLMGPRGYPLLLASGETANGTTELVDRQHPHDLFMELSSSYSHQLTTDDHIFVYGGLPGEPALGPPAFMHRMSIEDSPEAPISHHWLDSTHVTFGVVTVGYIHDNWKIEASQFRGREPDQYRTNIETGPLDSTSVRLSWNPIDALSLETSWAYVKSPEQLEPAENQRKLIASAIYTVPLVNTGGWWSTTLAWGNRSDGTTPLDAYALESALKLNPRWTIFARAERTANNELVTVEAGQQAPINTVGKVSLGAIRDWRVKPHLTVGLGGLYAVNFIPTALKAAYGDEPTGAMAFVRLKID
jgi:hypothetical protein